FRFDLRLTMCIYCGCGMYPYGAYSPYQYYGYPATYASYPSYGLPLGYAYAPPAAPAPPVYFAAAPAVSRGEYKVGNCLMICQ
ncbi:MAG TPA: hypothetical protein VEC43_00255, partial [Candidatus Acidoferrales bacterium]|nr:hypothetical protein [Candidatus Acidoferrales bacterium]